ncbi:hypothetical protein DH2020_006058 [Rehmannia glutinosa]|uniref:Uncharacterized protein n=1 Tax=Rehmannia glutinosa TaxID=99300 RepID=A0ABR0XHT8_REHGL
MSQEELGGGIGGSGDDNAGDKKKGKCVLPPIPESPSSTDEEEEEVDQTKATRRTTLDCLASLEESLPMNLWRLHRIGKKEHRLNKRRRLLLAHELLYDDKKTDDQKDGMSSSMPILPSDDDHMDQNVEDNKEDKSVNDDSNHPTKDDEK